MKERSNAEVRFHTLNIGRVNRTVRVGCDGAISDSLADQTLTNGVVTGRRLRNRIRSSCTEVRSNLIRQHLLETKAEQVWRIPAVRPGRDVPTGASSSARATVASSAAIGESSPDRKIRVDV